MESARLLSRTSGEWKRAALGLGRLRMVGSLRGIRGRDWNSLLVCYTSNREVLGGEDEGDGENGGRWGWGSGRGKVARGLTEKGSGRKRKSIHEFKTNTRTLLLQ